MGLVPKQTKSDVKFFKGLTMGKILGLILSGGLGFLFGAFLSPGKQILLSISFIIIFLIASSKSPSNPKITFFQGLKTWIKYLLGKKCYYGVSSEEYKEYERSGLVREEQKERRKQIKKDHKK